MKASTKGANVVEDNYFERKALESLNTFGMEALRELTGVCLLFFYSGLFLHVLVFFAQGMYRGTGN